MTKNRSRFLAIAATATAEVAVLSGCAASAETTAETTAHNFMRAALHLSDASVDDFLCSKGSFSAGDKNATSWEVSIDSTTKIEDGTWEVKATQTNTSENSRPQYPTTLIVRADGSCVESIVGVDPAEPADSASPSEAPKPSLGSEGNPLVIVNPDAPMYFGDELVNYSSPLYLKLGEGETLTIVNDGALDVASQSGVEVTTGEGSVTLTGTGSDGTVVLVGAIEGGASSEYEVEIQVVSK